MELFEHDDVSKVLVGNRWFLQIWDVYERSKEQEDIDCHSICNEIYEGNSKQLQIVY